MNIIRLHFLLFLLLLSVEGMAQCFIPDATLKYCEDEFTIDLTSSQVQFNGTYAYFFNGAQIFNDASWAPIPFAIVDGEFTENGTGCVATFKLTIEPILISEPDLEEEYFLSCYESEILLDPNINSVSFLTYQWFLDGGIIANSETVLVQTGGVYTLIVEELDSGCSVTAEVTVNEIQNELFTTDIIHNCDSTVTLILDFENDDANVAVEWIGFGVVDETDPYELTVDSIGNYTGQISNTETGCITPFQFSIDSLGCTVSSWSTPNEPVDLSIFPNPFSNILNISTKENVQYLGIIDQTGRLIVEKNISSIDLESLNLSQLPKGVYFLGLQIEGSYHWHKIFKK